MTDRLKILVLHNCENLAGARRSTLDFIYSFERYAPDHLYLYHRIMLPFTPEITGTDWDVVILDSTACGIVTLRPRERFTRIRDRMTFLRESKAAKFVFPQDDASHGALMDLWFNWLQIDALYTVRPEKVDLIYPITRQRAEVVSTLAGFLNDSMIEQAAKVSKRFPDRQWVVGQRVTLYPAWGGRFARRKGYAAERMKVECDRRGISNNISTNPADVLLGDEWTKFLGDCQFVVGAEGGHGIWDPYGTIQDSTNAYLAAHPGATFEEIEAACFPGLESVTQFPGFAPRILEAAIAGCGQVLVRGAYRGLIREGEHYIPLAEDFGNFDEVFLAMQNTDRVASMISATRRDLVENKKFHYRTFVNQVLGHSGAVREKSLGKSSGGSGSAEPAEWPSFRLAHFQSLRNGLATMGIDEERLIEPNLTAWIHRELGGQVTDPELRAALKLSGPSVRDMAPPPSRDPDESRGDTRSFIVQSAVSAIRSVDGAAEALLHLIAALKTDGDGQQKLRAVAQARRAELLAFGLELLDHVDGHSDALLPISTALKGDPLHAQKLKAHSESDKDALLEFSLELLSGAGRQADALLPALNAFRSDPEQEKRLQEIIAGRRSELVQQILGVLASADAVADALAFFADLVVKEPARLNGIKQSPAQDGRDLVRFSLEILKAVDGAEDAITPIASTIQPDTTRLAAGLEVLGKPMAAETDRTAVLEVFKRHMLECAGLTESRREHAPDDGTGSELRPEDPSEVTPEQIFNLLIAHSDRIREANQATAVYRVIEAAINSRLRGALIRALATARIEPFRAKLSKALLPRSD